MGIAEGAVIEAAAVGTILFSITGSSALVFAIDKPFVRGIYQRFFRGYPEEVVAEVAVVPLHDGAAVEAAAAEALRTMAPPDGEVDASADAMTAYAMTADGTDADADAPAHAERKESA
jgi:hypothetical protein